MAVLSGAVLLLAPFPAGAIETAGPTKSFLVQGSIRQIQAAEQKLVIAHEAIPGYMDAMTMPFHLKDPQTLKGLQAGDQVRFRLVVTETESWIEQVEVLAHGGPPVQSPTPSPDPAHKPAVPNPPKHDHPLLHYAFTNELGQPVRLGDFRGQALAITFFFTRCPIPDYCPRLSKNFEMASQKLAAMSNAPTNWHFLSVSFDSAHDTPAVLLDYARRYQYDARHWSFLTGPADKIAELANLSDVKFEKDGEFYTHNFRTLIIDAAGRLQTTFPTSGDLSDAIVEEILKAAAAPSAAPPAARAPPTGSS